MRVCIIGGIFGESKVYRSKVRFTPETVLENGLRAKGLDVDVANNIYNTCRPLDSYDVIHAHHLGPALTVAAANIKSVFVFTSHNGRMLCGYERSRIKRAAFHYILKKCDAAVALSRREMEYLARIAGHPKVHLIPNGIPNECYHLRSFNPFGSAGTYKILFVGQLIELKGVGILLQAIRQLLPKWNIRLLLVYQNSTLEDQYRRLARKLGIGDRVDFCGFLGCRDLAELYREVDLLVLPSFAEALPSVITEALLSGTPVVATRIGGIPEQVGRFGKLVQPGSVSELASAIDSLLKELPNFRVLSREMREWALRQFSVENMINSHLKLYEELVKRHKKGDNTRPSPLDKIIYRCLKVYRKSRFPRFFKKVIRL
jgi:glycosyltransferase involved in cell wall biosynthesis